MRAALLAVVLLAGGATSAQAPGDFDVDAAAREQLVTDIVRALEQNFVSPARLRQQLPALIGRWSSGELASLTRASELVRAINADFDDTLHDGHLRLLPPFAALSPMMFGPDKPSAAELARLDADAAATHYGIADAHVLDGNVGYLELMEFPGRRTGKRTESWTAATVPGPRYGTRRPIWVLTSHGTISGGESMAYALKSLGRARLVGEITAGAAHHDTLVRVGGRLVLMVPVGTVEDPRTHTSWEGVGVEPDVAVAADHAYDEALAAARAR